MSDRRRRLNASGLADVGHWDAIQEATYFVDYQERPEEKLSYAGLTV